MQIDPADSDSTRRSDPQSGAALFVHSGDAAGNLLRFPEGMSLIGAVDRCTAQLSGAGVAPVHAMLFHGRQSTVVRALASEAWLNGRTLIESAIQHGDRLVLGDVELEFVADLNHEDSQRSTGQGERSPLAEESSVGEMAEEGDVAVAAAVAHDVYPAANIVRALGQGSSGWSGSSERQRMAGLLQAEDHARRLQRTSRRIRRQARSLHSLAHQLQQRWTAQVLWLADREHAHAVEPSGGESAHHPASNEEGTLAQSVDAALAASGEWAELRRQMADLTAVQASWTEEQRSQFARLTDRCGELAVELAELRTQLDERLSERARATDERRLAQEQLVLRTDLLERRLDTLATTQSAAEARSDARAAEDSRGGSQRHSMEDRLAGLRAEREAFEDQRRKERAEQALSRHLGKLTTVGGLEPETAAPVEESHVPADESAPWAGAGRSQLSAEVLASPADHATHDESDNETEPRPAQADPFARLTRMLQTEESARTKNSAQKQPESAAEALPVASHVSEAADAAIADPSSEPTEPAPRASQPEESRSVEPTGRPAAAVQTPQFAPVSRESPLSTAELFRRMGTQPDLGDDEPAAPPHGLSPVELPAKVLHSTPTVVAPPEPLVMVQPAAAPQPAAKPVKPEAEAEESIDDYMARLLQRVRAVSGEVKSASSQKASDHTPGPQSSRLPEKSQDPPPKTPEELEREDLERRKQEYVRRAAPETKSDLKSLREVANLQARSDINTHARQRLVKVRVSKLAVTALAFCITLVLVALRMRGTIESYMGIVGGALVTLFWGLQYAFMALRAVRQVSAVRSDSDEAAGEGNAK